MWTSFDLLHGAPVISAVVGCLNSESKYVMLYVNLFVGPSFLKEVSRPSLLDGKDPSDAVAAR